MHSTTSYPAFLELDIPPASYEDALFHIISMPLEKSVSYGGGAAGGPEAILRASQQLEAFDGKSVPGLRGIHTHAPIACGGDDVEALLNQLADQVEWVLAKDGIPVVLGGEHTVTLGAVRGLLRSEKSFGVVQFDAHADLRDTYEDNPLSHACVMRRLHDLNVPFLQLGVRSLSQGEHEFREQHSVAFVDAERLYREGLPAELLPSDFPENVYITFDVDGLDPSIMPATGTPEPGGLGWYQALDLLQKISSQRRIIGFDVVELAPIPGLHLADFIAAKLVYTMIGLVAGQR